MAAVLHLGFWKYILLTVWTVKSRQVILHNRAKFCEDRLSVVVQRTNASAVVGNADGA